MILFEIIHFILSSIIIVTITEALLSDLMKNIDFTTPIVHKYIDDINCRFLCDMITLVMLKQRDNYNDNI